MTALRNILLSGGAAWTFVKITTVLFGAIAVSRLVPGPDRQVPNYRPRPLRATAKYAGGTALVSVLVAACAMAAQHALPPPSSRLAEPRPGTRGSTTKTGG